MNTIRYIEGNGLTLYVPTVLLTTSGAQALQASSLDDIHASLHRAGVTLSLVPMTSGTRILLQLPETLSRGSWALDIRATYEGRAVHLHVDGAVEPVANAAQSNWEDYVQAGTATLSTQLYIADSLMTDAEFETLKQTYRTKTTQAEAAIVAAQAAKTAAEAAALNAAETLTAEGVEAACAAAIESAGVEVDLSPVTSRLDNTTYGLQALKNAIDSIPGGGGGGGTFPTDYAKETTAQSAKTAADNAKSAADAAKTAAEGAKSAAEAITIPTDYAKESTASDAKTAAQSASALCTIIDGKLASRNAENEPVSVGAAVGGVALSIGADIDGQPLHDKVDALAALIGDVETLIAAL